MENRLVPQADTHSDKLYLLNDDEDRWCAYQDESTWKSDVQSLGALTVAAVEYVNDRISLIQITEAGGSGDWAVFDTYSIDKDGKVYSLKRTINVLPGDRNEEQTWTVQDGKAIINSSVSRGLTTLKPVEPTPVDLPEVPIIKTLQTLPFWVLIRDRLQETLSKGKVCRPDTR